MIVAPTNPVLVFAGASPMRPWTAAVHVLHGFLHRVDVATPSRPPDRSPSDPGCFPAVHRFACLHPVLRTGGHRHHGDGLGRRMGGPVPSMDDLQRLGRKSRPPGSPGATLALPASWSRANPAWWIHCRAQIKRIGS